MCMCVHVYVCCVSFNPQLPFKCSMFRGLVWNKAHRKEVTVGLGLGEDPSILQPVGEALNLEMEHAGCLCLYMHELK